MDDADLIIVGGGIAGGSLATVMARSGAKVILLERQSTFRDHVRGELLWPWGVKVARDLGLESVFLESGARVVRTVVAYDEGSETPETSDAGAVITGVHGSINLHHPVACAGLLEAATYAGAHVRVGIRRVGLASTTTNRVVRWLDSAGEACEATAPLVVGADGRNSVIRTQAAIAFEVDFTAHQIAGLLVEGIESDANLAARESDVLFLAFPQNDGRTRLYFNYPTEQRTRFVGRDASERFVSEANLECLNGAGEWHNARPAGPCATFPGADSRAATPLGDGVVLIGDAAGYDNPLRGQGLSMALQDVHDVARSLLDGAPANGLHAYVRARAVRQRLAALATTLTVWANDGFRVQDPDTRAGRREQIRQDTVLGALSRTIWEGFDAIPLDLTATEVVGRLKRP